MWVPFLVFFPRKRGGAKSLCWKCLCAFSVPYWGIMRFGALRAQSRKKSPKMSRWGLSASGPKRSRKRVDMDYFKTISTRVRLRFLDFLGPVVERSWGLVFGLLFRLWARRAQLTPLAGKRAPKCRGLGLKFADFRHSQGLEAAPLLLVCCWCVPKICWFYLKVLTKKTWFPLVREWKSWKLQWEQFLPRPGSP